MPEHVHVHAPHELHEGNERTTRRDRTLEIVAAFLLALSTLAIAWSGYQAARWSGLQAEKYSEATAARSLANRHQINAGEQRVADLLNFNRWLEVTTAGNAELTALYERRFRDEFRPAFDAWLAQDAPLHEPRRDPHAAAHAPVRAAGRARTPTGSKSIAAVRFEEAQGGHRARRRVRVHHRVLRRGPVLLRHLVALRVGQAADRDARARRRVPDLGTGRARDDAGPLSAAGAAVSGGIDPVDQA